MAAMVNFQLALDTVSAHCPLPTAHCRLQPGSGRSPALLVHLHGAVNREKRSVPMLAGFLPGMPWLPQMAVADPTMEHFDTLAAGWYLGWKGERLWESLGRAIRAKAEEIGARRVIYCGGSSGGFAALLFSHQHPGSIALLRNPQVDVVRHVYRRASDAYLKLAWDGDPAQHGVPTDLPKLYAGGMENRVIYLQSAGDRKHVHAQTPRFLSAIRAGDQDKVIFDSRFYGVTGHGSSIPNVPLRGWIQAALAVPYEAPGWADRVLMHHHAAASPPPAGPVVRQALPASDLALADSIARYQLEA